MPESLVQKVINRSNRNMLLLSIAGIIVVSALAILNMRYFYNFFAGPFEISPSALAALPSASTPQKYWLKVTGEEMLDTGIQYVTTSKSGSKSVDASYYAMMLEKRLMMVRLEGDHSGDLSSYEQTGWLSDISANETQKIIQALEADVPAIKGMFLPFKMETGNFRTGGYIGLVIGGVVLLLCLWGIWMVIQRTIDPNAHPVMKSLARFGPVESVINQIEAEMAAPHTTLGKLNLTPRWLVCADSSNLLATRFEDVVWVYKHVTTHRSYGVAVSKTYMAMVFDRFGAKLDLSAGSKEAKVDEILSAVVGRAPWAVIGYSKELETAWIKDRAGFLAAVQRRKSGAA